MAPHRIAHSVFRRLLNARFAAAVANGASVLARMLGVGTAQAVPMLIPDDAYDVRRIENLPAFDPLENENRYPIDLLFSTSIDL